MKNKKILKIITPTIVTASVAIATPTVMLGANRSDNNKSMFYNDQNLKLIPDLRDVSVHNINEGNVETYLNKKPSEELKDISENIKYVIKEKIPTTGEIVIDIISSKNNTDRKHCENLVLSGFKLENQTTYIKKINYISEDTTPVMASELIGRRVDDLFKIHYSNCLNDFPLPKKVEFVNADDKNGRLMIEATFEKAYENGSVVENFKVYQQLNGLLKKSTKIVKTPTQKSSAYGLDPISLFVANDKKTNFQNLFKNNYIDWTGSFKYLVRNNCIVNYSKININDAKDIVSIKLYATSFWKEGIEYIDTIPTLIDVININWK